MRCAWSYGPFAFGIDQFQYIKIQPNTIDLSARLCGINPHKLCSYSPEPRSEVYRFRLNFNISKLVNFMFRHLTMKNRAPCPCLKAGVHLKAVFWLGIMFLMQISRLRFKQSRICSLITHIYVLRRFVNFLVIFRFIWRQIVFLKGLVKFMEIGNFEDLVLF